MQSENNKHIAFYGDKRQKRDDGRGGGGGSIERCNATSRGANNGFILSATLSVTETTWRRIDLGLEAGHPDRLRWSAGREAGRLTMR